MSYLQTARNITQEYIENYGGDLVEIDKLDNAIANALEYEVVTLNKQNALIVEVITAMYDQVHEERDNLKVQLEELQQVSDYADGLFEDASRFQDDIVSLRKQLEVAMEAMSYAVNDRRVNKYAKLTATILYDALAEIAKIGAEK
jgi:predicted  nucleic acid-binding Zn-ribbon protein